VHNGIDTDDWARVDKPDRVRELGVDPDRPSVIFVGRITRQKGLPLFLRAAAQLPPGRAARALRRRPGHPEIEAEVLGLVEELSRTRDRRGVDPRDAPAPDVVALLTNATVFACPSIYEPLGIVNLEAMACETAVVATATGGIPEVVVDGETGRLVPSSRPPTAPAPRWTPSSTSPTSPPRSTRSSPTPTAPPRWAGPAGSARSTHFSWEAIAGAHGRGLPLRL
jgi:starch synthase